MSVFFSALPGLRRFGAVAGRFSAALVAVSVIAGAGPAIAQADATSRQDGVPTVTIINKAEPASQVAAPAEIDVTPSATREDKPEGVPAGATPLPTDSAASAPPPPPPFTLSIDIDLTRQLMTVAEHGAPLHTWQISSARYGYRTPTGTFQPTWMAKMWYSRQYDLAPMPHAIFFHKGVAIHGTYATRALGNPASHGCVRLALANAATLYKLVTRHGKERTQIVVHGTPDHSTAGRVARFEPRGDAEVVRFRRASPYRYLPPSSYGRGDAVYGPRVRRAYAAPRQAPRGLYNGYSYGYGF